MPARLKASPSANLRASSSERASKMPKLPAVSPLSVRIAEPTSTETSPLPPEPTQARCAGRCSSRAASCPALCRHRISTNIVLRRVFEDDHARAGHRGGRVIVLVHEVDLLVHRRAHDEPHDELRAFRAELLDIVLAGHVAVVLWIGGNARWGERAGGRRG